MKIRTLIVDDDAALRRSVGRALERKNFDVTLAASGEEALDLLDRHTVDVVLLDLHLPSMSGATLYHVIATQWPVLANRVIVMTGEVDIASDQSWLELNRLAFLPKPFDLRELLDEITRLLPDQLREANGP